MGSYTQFFFNATLDLRDHPEVLKLLVHIRKHEYDLLIKPDHDLFSTERWDSLFHCKNWDEHTMGMRLYHCVGKEGRYDLKINSEFRNYDSEIAKFVDWIHPYVAGRKKRQYVGWHLYEHAERRTNIYILRYQEKAYEIY